MLAASLILFVVVWNAVGGWQGLEKRLAADDPQLADRMLHIGVERVESEVETRTEVVPEQNVETEEQGVETETEEETTIDETEAPPMEAAPMEDTDEEAETSTGEAQQELEE